MNMSWKIGPTRVVQNDAIPRIQYGIVRTRYAPQIATANTAMSIGRTFSSGEKRSVRTAAIGSHMTIVTSFQPARRAMSRWIGKRGWSSMADSSPWRIRSSQPYGVKMMFIWRTKVQTM